MRRWFTAGVIFCLALFVVPSQADTATGIAWLAGQAQNEGAYSSANDLATPVQATAETLRTFQALDETTQPGITAARQWLAEQDYPNTEYLARQLIAAAEAGQSTNTLVTELLTHQNSIDGGFGDLPGYQSTVLDTAFALEALAVSGERDTAVSGPAIGYLLNRQAAGGSWADGANAPSVYVSALAMRALWQYRTAFNVIAALDQAQAFLLNQRVGDRWASAFETASALLAILPRLDSSDTLAPSINALAAEQAADGSWAGDVFSTALALRALAFSRNTVPNPDLATLTGRVLDGDTGLPLSGVTVELGGLATASTVTGTEGRFQFSGLADGGYTLALTLVDYGTLTATTTLPVGGTVDLGDLNLLRQGTNPTTGTIRGMVTDADTGQPLAGVTIDANSQSTTTAADGSYQISNVPPGQVTLTASLAGYVNASGNATLVAGGVLLFSPSLTPETDPNADAALFGVITEADTGAPLVGVTVTVSGDTDASVQTDATGAYRIEPLNPGSLTITVSLADYDTVVANATVFERAQLTFSPVLYPSGTTPPGENSASVTGVVVDSVTNAPLASAIIEAQHGAVTEQIITDVNGRFTVSEITAEEVSLRFSLEGYQASELALLVELLADQDIGQVRLRPIDVQALLPDLVVTDIDTAGIQTDLQTLELSGVLRVGIQNEGTSSAPGFFDVLAFEDIDANSQFDATVDVMLGSVRLETSLAVGEQVTAAIEVANTVQLRDAPISVWVDNTRLIVEADEDNNYQTTSEICRILPTPIDGTNFTTKWHWQSHPDFTSRVHVVGPVMVGQLSDDNGDDIINTDDIPDLVFAAGNHPWGASQTVLMAVSGDDGHELWNRTDISAAHRGAGALGDIDNDGLLEIIVTNINRTRLIALENDGTIKWSVNTGPSTSNPSDGIVIADLDADGNVEIVHGNRTYDATGELLWIGTQDRAAGGHSSLWGFVPIVADVDLDSFQEVVAGRTVYRFDGEVLWHRGDLRGDGYNAVGNFDADDEAEIVLVAKGRVYLLEHTGETIWGPVALPGGSNRGGPPTVADFDGDNEPEIGIAGATRYTVFESDGSIKWSNPIQDTSSAATGSSVFDFEADGKAEVLYGDERYFRIYDGETGATLVEIENGSVTSTEYPVVADIDNDGGAEIIVPANYQGPVRGIRVFGPAQGTWAPTRSLWNQHSYHINNINDDGTIPQYAQPSWLSHNTYRLNTFLDRNPLDSADLSVALLRLVDNGTGQSQSLTARIGNGGLLSISQAIAVTFYQGDPSAGGVLLGTVTLDSLASGAYTDIRLDDVTLASQEPLYAVVDLNDQYRECDETNNRMSIPLSTVPLGTITVSTDAAQYGPQSPANLQALVTNTGSFASDYTAVLEILDSSGALVTRFDAQPVTALGAGEFLELGQAWNTGTTLAGDYTLRGTLYAPNGSELDTAEALFTIGTGGTPTASLRTTTDRASYHTSDTVQIGNLARNTTTNVLIPAAQIEIQVTDPTGQPLFSDTLPIGDLAPGGQRELTTPLTLQASPEGEYTVTGTLRDGNGAVLATDQTTFTVQESVTLALSGTVTAMYPELERGEGQVCTDELNYTGTQPLTAQPIRQLVVRLDDDTPLQSTDQTLDLNPGAAQTLSRNIATAGFEAGDHACVLQAEIAGQWQTLDAAVFTVTEAPIELDGELSLGERGRILILLDDPAQHPGPDPHGPGDAPTLDEQRTYLETLLTEAGWSYTITTAADAFTTEFRSGEYSTYLILSEHIKLPEQIQEELREAVFRGEGLIVAGDHDQRNGRLDEPLGIMFKGKTGKPDRLRLITSELHPATEVDLRTGDTVQRAELQGAVVAGYFGAASDGSTPPVPAIDLGPAAPYNVLVFGDFSAPYSDVEGRLAAGGNVSINHYSVGDKLDPASAGDVLVVGGDLTFPSGRVYYGNILVGGSAAGVGDPVLFGIAPGAELREFATLPINFSTAESTLKALSEELALLPANGTAEFRWGGLYLSGDGSSELQVFTLDGAQVLQSHTFQVDGLPQDATAIFNISGAQPGLTNMSLDSLRNYRERTLFNFPEANTLTLAGIGVEGSILAPWAAVNNPQGVIKGTLVAGSFDGPMQLNHHPFLGHPGSGQDIIAVTTHDYGFGRSVYAGFDLLSEATAVSAANTTSVFADLLLNALTTVHPQESLAVTGGVTPLRLSITNQGIETPVVVTLTASPTDTTVIDALASRGETESPAMHQQRWVFELPESAEANLTTWWQLPELGGLVTFNARLQTGDSPNLVDHDLLNLDIDVQARPNLSEAQAELQQLAAADNTFNKALQKLDKAADKLAQGQLENALQELLKAGEELAKITHPEVDDARRLVAQVLATVARQTLD